MWLTLLPYALQFIGWIFSKYNASEETQKKFMELVQASKNDGLIAVDAKDTFKKQKAEILNPRPPEPK